MSDASDYESGPFCGKCFQSPEDCECKAEAAKAEAEQLNRRITELEAKRDAERAENEVIVEKLQADLASSHARAERWKSRLKDRQRTRPCKHAREAARYYREVARLRAAIEAAASRRCHIQVDGPCSVWWPENRERWCARCLCADALAGGGK